MMQSFKNLMWSGSSSISPEGTTALVPSSSSKNPTPSLFQGTWSIKVTPISPERSECLSTQTSLTSIPMSPKRVSCASFSPPRMRPPSEHEFKEEVHIVPPQNTTVKTAQNNQEITTITSKTATVFKKSILIEPSIEDTSVIKRQGSTPSSTCHSLVTPTRIPQPLIIGVPLLSAVLPSSPRLIDRRSSSVIRMLPVIPEQDLVSEVELLRCPTEVEPDSPISSPVRKSLFKEIMRR